MFSIFSWIKIGFDTSVFLFIFFFFTASNKTTYVRAKDDTEIDQLENVEWDPMNSFAETRVLQKIDTLSSWLMR